MMKLNSDCGNNYLELFEIKNIALKILNLIKKSFN